MKHLSGVNMLTIISASLRSSSSSRVLAKVAHEVAQQSGIRSRIVDLRDFSLTLCDGEESFSLQQVEQLKEILRESQAVIFASPIYNYDVSSALKNLIEHVGGELNDKVVGLMCAAGGERSYMSGMPFLNSLMLDFRSLIVPRFVYATQRAFSDERVMDEQIVGRIKNLVLETDRITQALLPMR
jgi:NAD(P)H-dependent FMN reductase